MDFVLQELVSIAVNHLDTVICVVIYVVGQEDRILDTLQTHAIYIVVDPVIPYRILIGLFQD